MVVFDYRADPRNDRIPEYVYGEVAAADVLLRCGSPEYRAARIDLRDEECGVPVGARFRSRAGGQSRPPVVPLREGAQRRPEELCLGQAADGYAALASARGDDPKNSASARPSAEDGGES